MPRKKPAITTEQWLKAVVYRNHAMTVEERPGGGCLASVPLRRPGWLIPPLSWLLPFSPCRRVELDPPGAEVLGLCDDRHCVEEIIELFASSHKLTFREAQLSVTSFLRQLAQRGLIAAVGLEKGRS